MDHLKHSKSTQCKEDRECTLHLMAAIPNKQAPRLFEVAAGRAFLVHSQLSINGNGIEGTKDSQGRRQAWQVQFRGRLLRPQCMLSVACSLGVF